MSGYPRSCEEVKQDLRERHQPFIDAGWQPQPIGEDAVVYRLIREQDLDFETRKPSKSSFSNHGLSVLIESANYHLDLDRCLRESEVFVGAVQLDIQDLQDMGYEICLDPHPDLRGRSQHPNHAQVVCKKNAGQYQENEGSLSMENLS